MPLISRLRSYRYCAFCKSPRRIYAKKHVDLTNVALAVAFSVCTTYAAFGAPDPRGLLLFCLFIIGAEIFVYLRWRLALACHLCGFDPVIYKRSPERAAAGVKKFFAEQLEKPEFWLTKSPLLAVQKRIRAQEKKAVELQIVSQRAKATSLAPPKSL